jgi:hypothetical protein
MSARLSDPERWSDRPARDTKVESAIGASLRRVKQATEHSELAVEALGRRLVLPRRRARIVPLAWRVAFAAALLVSMGGVVGAVRHLWPLRQADHRPEPRVEPIELRSKRVARPAGPAADEPPKHEPSGDEPPPRPPESPPAASSEAMPKSGARRAVRPVALPDETEVLAIAFRALRSGGDPAGALRALDEYDRRFPAGLMHEEARIARAKALMAQDRRADALPLLASIAEDDGALTRNVRITRGELYAEAGRCAEATRDFDRVLVIADDDAIGGRALYGRASCRLAARALAGARADLERYLSVHADGAFAAAARRALESLP